MFDKYRINVETSKPVLFGAYYQQDITNFGLRITGSVVLNLLRDLNYGLRDYGLRFTLLVVWRFLCDIESEVISNKLCSRDFDLQKGLVFENIGELKRTPLRLLAGRSRTNWIYSINDFYYVAQTSPNYEERNP